MFARRQNGRWKCELNAPNVKQETFIPFFSFCLRITQSACDRNAWSDSREPFFSFHVLNQRRRRKRRSIFNSLSFILFYIDEMKVCTGDERNKSFSTRTNSMQDTQIVEKSMKNNKVCMAVGVACIQRLNAHRNSGTYRSII